MYSLEDRMKAIQRFLKYDRNTAAVIRELGYPSRRALREWVLEYETAGALHDRQSRRRKYSEGQKQAAVKHCLEHGRNLQGSIRALGYPSKGAFRQWLDEAVADRQQGLHSKRKHVAFVTGHDKIPTRRCGQKPGLEMCDRQAKC